jgi:hypothetical protein
MHTEHTKWETPEMVELTLEDASELTNIDLACASTWAGGAVYDHG